MGKGGGSQPQNQTVTQTNLPRYAKPYFENLLQRGQAESYREYTPYGAERIAGFTPGQTAAQQEAAGMKTPGQFGAGTGLIGAGGLGSLASGAQYMGMATSPGAQQAFMSPYMQNVVDVQKREAITDAQKQQLMANLGAARQGTYGGSRQLLAGTERERALGQQLSDIQARGLQSAYDQAMKSMQFGSELGLRGYGQAAQAGQALGQMGTAEQAANLERLKAQSAVGAEQRAFEQQKMDQDYADFLRQRDYPMEQLGYFSSLLRGLPMQMGSTQTTYAQPPSIASQVGGLGLAGLGLSRMLGGQ